MKILYRYIFKELSQTFLFILFSLFFLFVLIDYSTHIKYLSQEGLSLYSIGLYYVLKFTQKAEVFLPMALMIATLKVLLAMQRKNELLALLAAGIPFKKLYRPFWWLSFLVTFYLLINFQYVQPSTLFYLDHFEKSFFNKKGELCAANKIVLPQTGFLLYEDFNREKKVFSNLFFVKNFSEIYHIETLTLTKELSIGEKVTLFTRSGTGELVKKGEEERLFLPSLDKDVTSFAIMPTKNQPLTQLAKKLGMTFFYFQTKGLSDKDSEMASLLSYKLLSPLLALLAVLAPASFALTGRRIFSVFLLFAAFIFGLFAFFTLIQSAHVLGENQLLPAFWSQLTPFIVIFAIFGRRYASL